MKELVVAYNDEKGQEIKLTGSDIVEYISTDSSVTEKEVVQFLNMCKYLKLNPFLKEIYLIKYKGSPATFVVSYQSFLKRAEENPNFDGYETTIEGKAPDLTASAIVYRKDRTHPVKVSVSYGEAVKTILDKQTGKLRPTNMWRNMPEWMLRKVALARALKEAFPSAIGNAQVAESDIVDINSDDNAVIERRKDYKGDANKDLYGIETKPKEEPKPEEPKPEEPKTEPNPENLKSKLYEILKEKKIDTIAKVKELLKSVFPNTNFNTAGKYVFENMPDDRIRKVIEYLK